MSLINQVLQDLDRRHANGSVPAAVKALPSGGGTARYWRVLAMSAAALVVIAGGAGVAAWSMGARSAPGTVGRAAALVPAPVALPAPTPVVVVTAASSMVAADPAPVRPVVLASVEKTAKWVAPVHTAPAAKTVDSQTVTAFAPMSVATNAVPSTAPATHAEPRIEKRSPGRTARERAEAEYQRGVAAHQHGQWADAAAAYATVLREEPSFASARQALAGVMIGQGRTDDATNLLSEGIAMAPQHAGLAMTLAHLLVERGELQRAADVLQPSDAASMSAEDHAFRAAVLQRLNRHLEASEHFAAALRTAPNNGVWWMGLGMSQAAEGRSDTAKEAFNRARSSGSLSPELTLYVEQRLKQL